MNWDLDRAAHGLFMLLNDNIIHQFSLVSMWQVGQLLCFCFIFNGNFAHDVLVKMIDLFSINPQLLMAGKGY